MERFSVKFSDAFFEDLKSIVQFIAEKSGSMDVRRILWSGMNMPRLFDGDENNREK